MTSPASKVSALRTADHVAHTWLVGERVSLAIDEHDAHITTCVYFDAQHLTLSLEEHDELFDAYERIYDLLHGGWRDYFDDNPALLAELVREAAQ